MEHSSSSLRIVWTTTVCTAVSLFGDATLYAVLPSRYEQVGIIALQVGWLLSINRLVRLPLNFASGWLSDRFGFKWPYVIGMSIGALSTLGFGLFKGVWPLLLLRALWGVAWALLVVASYGLIFEASTPSNRGRYMGTFFAFSRFGGAMGGMLGGFLVDVVGMALAMFILSACGAGAVLLALTLPNPRLPQPCKLRRMERRDAFSRLRALGLNLRNLDTRLWVIASSNFIQRLVLAGVFYSTFGLYLRHVFGPVISMGTVAMGVASLTGVLLFIRNALGLALSPAFGALSDRLGNRKVMLLAGELAGAVGFAFLATGRALWGVAVSVLFISCAYSLIPGILLAWMGDLTRQRRGATVGGFQTMGDLGAGLGPLVAYPVMILIGIRGVYAVAGGLLALTVVASLVVLNRKPNGKSRSQPAR